MRRRILNAGPDSLRIRCPFFACAAVILSSALAGHGKPVAANVRPIDPNLQVASLVVRELAPSQPISYLPAALEGSGYRLAPNDRALYRRIFDATAAKDHATADQLLSRVEDSRLRGHVLARRWLTDSSTQPDFAGLKQWLDQYSDLPQADQVLALAKAKRPPGASLPKLGVPGSAAVAVERGVPEPANRMAEIAAQAFYDGDAKKALNAANAALATLGNRATDTRWIAGLAAWRLGQLDQASRHFEALSTARGLTPWMQSAANYWAGRVRKQIGDGNGAQRWWARAAQHRTTFYGLLAQRSLSPNVDLAIKPAELIGDHIAQLAETPAGYRAIALLDVGEFKLAQAELEEIDYDRHAELREPALAVGDTLRMTQLVRDLTEPAAMSRYVAAQYPIPPWQPRGGFAVDPALVYALVKQESRFDPMARNPSGATGLMQLMPGTAAAIGGEHVRSQLTDPETNLALGQQYVAKLLKDPEIDGDLFLMAVAYNVGPGALQRWRKAIEEIEDPLLFIEQVPKGETRQFIQRVLTNYWIYRLKFRQDVPSLAQLAAGEWPQYEWKKPKKRLAALVQ
jgi:soluble lytic murein transglycosylase